jgi:hypothetical protein
MYLAYSAFNTVDTQAQIIANQLHDQTDNELMLRYQAYQNACNKYSREIASIQKYIPGWMPKFR